jgi:hypothetical protein
MGAEPLTHPADRTTGTAAHTIVRRGRAFVSQL